MPTVPPMTKPGRIPCINPRCRRTAPADKYEPGTQIICGKCWKLVPESLRKRDRYLWRHHRKLERYRKRGLDPIEANRVDRLIDQVEGHLHSHWGQIRACFIGDSEKPEGLDAFLEEMNLN